MKGYILIDLEITDPEGFKEYLKLAGPSQKLYGAKILVGGATSEILEGDWSPHMLAIGEFESVEQAMRWYHSEEYAPAKELRLRTTKSQAIVVQGLES
jgi:uncharacterized protein (DUF1330 family)